MTRVRFLGALILACSLVPVIPACQKGPQESARPVEPSPDLARRPLIWPAAEPGSYEVGYRVLHEYDSTRTFKPKFDYFGRRTEGSIARPIQISVWYPAAPAPGLSRMKLEDYYFTTATELDFASPSTERLTILKNRLKNIWPIEFRIPPEGRAAFLTSQGLRRFG